MHRTSIRLLVALASSGGIVALLVALTGSLVASAVTGIAVLGAALVIAGKNRRAADVDAPADVSDDGVAKAPD